VRVEAKMALIESRIRQIESRMDELFGPRFQLEAARRGGLTPLSGDVVNLTREAAIRHGVDPDLFERLVAVESGGNARAVSSAGAVGLTQLMPATADALGVVDPYDPVQNLDGGARYLRSLLDRFDDPRLAVAAYNAGPGAVERYGDVPPYGETEAFVARVLGAL
jgi:soluble lytic murein transglycosylase-like protein